MKNNNQSRQNKTTACCTTTIASAPGSVMLMGEHAVLHGYPAIVTAVDKRLQVKLTPIHSRKIEIISALGSASLTLDDLIIKAPFHFVGGVFSHFLPYLSHGFKVEIVSGFSHKVGLGSSAAVVVALTCALRAALNNPFDHQLIFDDAYQIMRRVQTVGSGADIAASVFGGVLFYVRNKPPERFDGAPAISLAYSGHKTPTVEVIATVEKNFENKRDSLTHIYQTMGALVEKAKRAFIKKDWQSLGRFCTLQQTAMQQLGVATPALDQLVADFLKREGVYGAKISGSGLGDCAIAVGEFDIDAFCDITDNIAIAMTKQGVTLDE
jgi:mevalonate kinase